MCNGRSVPEAGKYYPLFGLGANVALIFSGQYVRYVSGMRRALAGLLTTPTTTGRWQVVARDLVTYFVSKTISKQTLI